MIRDSTCNRAASLWRLDPPRQFRRPQVTVQNVRGCRQAYVGERSDADLDESRGGLWQSGRRVRSQFTTNNHGDGFLVVGRPSVSRLPYSAGRRAPYEIRDASCMTAGEKVMVELVDANIRRLFFRHRHPNSWRTPRWLRPPVGRPTQGCTCRHRPRRGIKFEPCDVRGIFKKDTLGRGLKPGGS